MTAKILVPVFTGFLLLVTAWQEQGVYMVQLLFEQREMQEAGAPVYPSAIIPQESFVIPDDVELKQNVDLDVPFASQAPFGNWSMPYQEACEEASLIMVKYFLDGEKLDAATADKEIVDMVEWQIKNAYAEDINIGDTLQVAKNYYKLEGKVFYDDEVNVQKIKELLSLGHPVIIPAAGHLLGNPNFTPPGPPYHMIVIKGYDETHFITHDPGTRLGANYRYTFEVIDKAIHDWSGTKEGILEGRRGMMILKTM